MEKVLAGILAFFLMLLVIFGVAYAIPGSRAAINEYFFLIERVDEETDYENRKKVEDTARAMIATYTARKLEYEQYKDFESGTPEYTRALDAKTAANNTASAYNNYITQNSFVWEGNLPSDIPNILPYI